MMENAQRNQQLHVPTQRLVIVFKEMGEGGVDKQGGGRGDVPRISPLSQTSKATPMERYINELTLDITVKTDV